MKCKPCYLVDRLSRRTVSKTEGAIARHTKRCQLYQREKHQFSPISFTLPFLQLLLVGLGRHPAALESGCSCNQTRPRAQAAAAGGWVLLGPLQLDCGTVFWEEQPLLLVSLVSLPRRTLVCCSGSLDQLLFSVGPGPCFLFHFYSPYFKREILIKVFLGNSSNKYGNTYTHTMDYILSSSEYYMPSKKFMN